MSYVLYNAAHKNTSIRSQDGKAWIRILGFFDSKDAALEHASKLNFKQKQEIRIAKTHSFRMIMQDKISESLREKETAKHSYLTSTHIKLRNHAITKTQENADLRKMGLTSLPLDSNVNTETKVTSKIQVPTEPRTQYKTENLLPLTRDDEIRMQRFAAISVLPDYEVLAEKSRLHESLLTSARQEYTKRKNQIISKKVKEGFVLPTHDELAKKFVESFPPPFPYDCYGRTESSDTLNLNDTNISTWLQMKNEAIETELFTRLGIEKPDFPEIEHKDDAYFKISEEPAVMFLTFSEREDEMEKAVQKIVDTDMSMKHYDIACVAMYEWLSIETLQLQKEQIRVKYRDSHLAKLHDARLAQSEEASTLLQSGSAKVIEIGNE
jgi:hypothetical protein